LLYLHFELLLRGYYSIYLGQSVPTNNLQDLKNSDSETIFVTYLTVEPSKESIEIYLEDVYNSTLKNSNDSLWVLGYKITQIESETLDIPQVKIFKSPLDLLNII